MGQESERLQCKLLVCRSQHTTYYKFDLMWMWNKEKVSSKRIFLKILLLYKQMLLSLESERTNCLRKEKPFLRLVYVF